MNERDALINAILVAEPPECWDAMRVLADWLAERGDPLERGYRRMADERWRLEVSLGAVAEYGKWIVSKSDRNGERSLTSVRASTSFASKREAVGWLADYLAAGVETKIE